MELTEQKLLKIRSGEIRAEQNIRSLLKKIAENKELNAFLYVAEKDAIADAVQVDIKIKAGKAGRLAGLGIAVKANINVKGMPISCSSKTLENYYGTYDADVIKRIKKEDGIIIGILNSDEFACGISGETSAFGGAINPMAKEVVPGGSSSGSAVAVATGLCDLSLGSDTGGSIRNPASHCGVIGIKPSYGRVSRYGLIDLSMSLDQIGPISPDIYGAALLMEVISGYSNSDPTTFDYPVPSYTQSQISNATIGLSKEFKDLCTNKELYALIERKAQEIGERFPIKNVSLKYTSLGVQTYYPIVYTEFFSGTRKFDGRRFGRKIEESAGEEVLRRIMGGREISRAEHAGQYYRKALATKELIRKDFEDAFKQVDIIITPTTPELPHKPGTKITPEQAYAMDAFTIPANLAGVAAGVIPIGKLNDIPVGMQIIVPAFKEEVLFGFLKEIK